jgi:hypothetical protein
VVLSPTYGRTRHDNRAWCAFPSRRRLYPMFPFSFPVRQKIRCEIGHGGRKAWLPLDRAPSREREAIELKPTPRSSPALPLFTWFHSLPFHLMLLSTTSTGPLHAEVTTAHHARAVPLVLQFRLRLKQLASPDSQSESEEVYQTLKNQKK